jgi:membrane protease YdiL (CAAX protease family)
MHRSLVVLGGHLAWVLIGSIILGVLLRPQPFFGGGNKIIEVEGSDRGGNIRKKAVSDNASKQEISKTPMKKANTKIMRQRYKWYSNKWNDNFLFWSIAGYSISCWFFNLADFINQIVLPAHVFESAGEGVVSQLINPENNDIAASLVGYIAPCISAPWFEEVLYRGFLLPALCLQMNFWLAVFVSGIVFSIHHVSTTGAIPLAILGWTWAGLYAKSGNLFVTILIHAMWNSRVFLGSWLGL